LILDLCAKVVNIYHSQAKIFRSMKQPIHIRQAAAEDIPLLVAMGRKTFYEAFAKQNTKENMDLFMESQFQPAMLEKEMQEEGAVFFLAYQDSLPVGFTKIRTGHEPEELWAGSPFAHGSAIEIERIYVVAEFQDQKIGSAIMAHNIEYARNRGFKMIWLGVWERNTAAIRFYERWAFELFGSHIFILGAEPQTDVLMKRRI
jgi:diamine N-acetyltransferase